MPNLDRNHHEVDHAVWTGLPSPWDEYAMRRFPVWYVFEIRSKKQKSDLKGDFLLVRGKGTDLDVVSQIEWETWVAIAAENREAAKERFWLAYAQSLVAKDPTGMGHEILKDWADPDKRCDSFREYARQHYEKMPPFRSVDSA